MTMLVTKGRGLGDILSDVESAASALSASFSPGGLAAWFQQRIAALNALPNDVRSLQAQIAAVSQIIANAGNDNSAVSSLTAASNDVASIASQYPAVNSSVGQAMVTVTPLLGSLSSSILPLLLDSPGLISAFDGLSTLLAMRDDARTQLQAITTDMNLTPQVQQQVAQAIASNVSSSLTASGVFGWVLLGLGGLVAYKVAKKIL